ncbi:MAG: hypothetical protein LAO30_05570 [Acidobacteriia bacterium]|nr:hypothetical protein [Terriglobia bacterium]
MPTPADADLVFEVRFVAFTGKHGFGGREESNPEVLQLHLLILDPNTHVVLWSFAEEVEGAIMEGNARKNFDQAMVYLVDDVKKLTKLPVAAGGAANK